MCHIPNKYFYPKPVWKQYLQNILWWKTIQQTVSSSRSLVEDRSIKIRKNAYVPYCQA